MDQETYEILERYHVSRTPPDEIVENVKQSYLLYAESPEAQLRWLVDDTKDRPQYHKLYTEALDLLLSQDHRTTVPL